MKRILFIDHESHLQTKSADFFLDLLRRSFEVETFHYSECYRARIPPAALARADLVILWEFLLDRRRFAPVGKPCLFVPMMDNEWGSRFQWRRLARSGLRVLSFCDAVMRMARRAGMTDVLDVRYALDPARFPDAQGDLSTVALWERGGIGFGDLKKIFRPGQFKKVILFRRPAANIRFAPVSDADRKAYNVEIRESAFLPDDEYDALLKEPGVYVAPRYSEGIGLAFLEQLARGKVVVAHDAPTMNEYLADGKNGFLVDFRRATLPPLDNARLASVRPAVRASAQAHYRRWLADRETIAPFVENAANGPAVRPHDVTDALLYLGFLAEGALRRLREFLHLA